jgi:retron-type reverse transcriptase
LVYSINTNKRQKTSKEDLAVEAELETQGKQRMSSELLAVPMKKAKSGISTENLLERVVNKQNVYEVYKRVKRNKGGHGIDGMSVDELLPYLQQNADTLILDLLNGKYRPKPVRRKEIPKHDGGIRLLVIPTVIDRLVQQAIAQVLNPIFDKEFSNNSYGFRHNRKAHMALEKSVEYINSGYRYVVDMDLEKFFDTVNHDILMALIARKIKDKRLLKLIRRFLNSGIMINGVVVTNEDGAPQGGPLSPLLSNIMLDELDKELEERGHKFAGYVDDCNIFVKSKRAGNRVLENITMFLERKLKLKEIIVGWVNYYKLADMEKKLKEINGWIRRCLRACIWKTWKKVRTRFRNLAKLGVPKYKAWEYANTQKVYWRIAGSPILSKTITNQRLINHGFVSVSSQIPVYKLLLDLKQNEPPCIMKSQHNKAQEGSK